MPHRKTLKNLFLEANRPPSISQPIGKTCSPLGQEVWSLLLNDRKGACVTKAPSECDGAELYER